MITWCFSLEFRCSKAINFATHFWIPKKLKVLIKYSNIKITACPYKSDKNGTKHFVTAFWSSLPGQSGCGWTNIFRFSKTFKVSLNWNTLLFENHTHSLFPEGALKRSLWKENWCLNENDSYSISHHQTGFFKFLFFSLKILTFSFFYLIVVSRTLIFSFEEE